MKQDKKWLTASLIIIIIGLLGLLVYLSWDRLWFNQKTPEIIVNSFETCVEAGNPVMESYPRQCHDAKSNQTFTEILKDDDQPPTTRRYQSSGGVEIEIDNWADDKKVASPLEITGRVPGNWSFEASFPIVLESSSGEQIAQGVAQLQGDWMTEQPVPFIATLEFTDTTPDTNGVLVLQKDNPSGLPENDDSLRLSVKF